MSVQTDIIDEQSATRPASRRLPVGAEVIPGGGVSFRVWAPLRRCVTVVFEDSSLRESKLSPEANGYFSGIATDAGSGANYRFRLDGESLYPDPASRFQPNGPHGPSQVSDQTRFKWTDYSWPGVGLAGLVLYEMHIGTFTKEGTWAAAERELPRLKGLGITCLELMPVADFAGSFGWGYDGVNLFAPTRLYGTPDDFRRFVDRAHSLSIGVILDVVYNHIGPDGNYLSQFAQDYFNPKHKTDWGDAINFDGHSSKPVREFYLANARYWIEEFHLDGFRFDATQAIIDNSPRHILVEITQTARKAAGKRSIYLINENEPQDTRLVRPIDTGGYGMDALWNDDFHHTAMVVLSGHSEAYFHDHLGVPQEFVSAAKWGYLFQGQRYSWQGIRRGTPALDLPPTAFVNFIQNHDQIANSGRGLRAHELTGIAQYRAMTAVLLLLPQTPMIFQGQEFGASTPFLYFADHKPELAKLIREGRAKELSQFPSVATDEMTRRLAPPDDRSTFDRCKLDFAECEKPAHAELLQMHKDLLGIRHKEPCFRRVQRRGDIDGAVIGSNAFVLRFFGDAGDDRLLCVNFGRDLSVEIAPEPLLAPPVDRRWSVQWSSESPRYGGSGTPPPETEREGWFLRGRCAILLQPKPAAEALVETRVKRTGTIE